MSQAACPFRQQNPILRTNVSAMVLTEQNSAIAFPIFCFTPFFS
jgi:hypothetical protein